MGVDARHAVSPVEPPSDPMGIEEAKAFAHRVASAWLDTIVQNVD
jgi:hypothetical protein